MSTNPNTAHLAAHPSYWRSEGDSETVDKIAAAAVRAGEALEKALDEQYPE